MLVYWKGRKKETNSVKIKRLYKYAFTSICERFQANTTSGRCSLNSYSGLNSLVCWCTEKKDTNSSRVNVRSNGWHLTNDNRLRGIVPDNQAIWVVGVKCIMTLLNTLYVVWGMMLKVNHQISWNFWKMQLDVSSEPTLKVMHQYPPCKLHSWAQKWDGLLSLTAWFYRTLPLNVTVAAMDRKQLQNRYTQLTKLEKKWLQTLKSSGHYRFLIFTDFYGFFTDILIDF